MTECPKCGYAGIGPCSCEYKSAQPAQLSAEGPRLQSAREFLMSIDADDYGGCGRVTVEDLVKLLEAYASAVAQRERPEDVKVLQELVEDYQKAADDSGQHHLIAPEQVKDRFDALRDLLREALPYIESGVKCEVENPGSHQEFKQEAIDLLRKCEIAAASLLRPTPEQRPNPNYPEQGPAWTPEHQARAPRGEDVDD